MDSTKFSSTAELPQAEVIVEPREALALPREELRALLLKRLARRVQIPSRFISDLQIVRRSMDARGGKVLYKYLLRYTSDGSKLPPLFPAPTYKDVHKAARSVLIVGAGPAGLFAALRLIQEGIKPIIIERGRDVHARRRDIAAMVRTAMVNPNSNYCFGEGGAGTFSDGKLYTRSTKRGDVAEVLSQLVHFGAEESIMEEAHPHIGTDKLPTIIENIRKHIISCGGEVHFSTKMTDLLPLPDDAAGAYAAPGAGAYTDCCADAYADCGAARSASAADSATSAAADAVSSAAVGSAAVGSAAAAAPAASVPMPRWRVVCQRYSEYGGAPIDFYAENVILAAGHSAKELYQLFYERGWALEAKGFAMGVRVEHSQRLINRLRYHLKVGDSREEMERLLPAAEYSAVCQVEGRGVFSFCMCPGGVLVPSMTNADEMVLNGMSNSGRDSRWANAGVVVQIEPEDIHSFEEYGPLKLLKFQESVEQRLMEYCKNEVASRKNNENSMQNNAASMQNNAANISTFAQYNITENIKTLQAPAQRMEDFVSGKISSTLPKSSYMPGVISAPLHKLLPKLVVRRLREGFKEFDKKMRGYLTNEALLVAVESRTSSPVRIVRNPETLEAPGLPGIYPCGEGAGYSGGIVSSAIDGINVAKEIADSHR